MKPERQPASRPTSQGARTFTRSARSDFSCATAMAALTGDDTAQPGLGQLPAPVQQGAVEPPGLIARIRPDMPTTWVAKAFKGTPLPLTAIRGKHLQLLVLAAVSAAVMAGFVGRWRLVEASALRPSMDL